MLQSKSKGYTKPLAKSSLQSVRCGSQNLMARYRFVQAVLDASQDIIMEHPFILSELPFGHIGVPGGG